MASRLVLARGAALRPTSVSGSCMARGALTTAAARARCFSQSTALGEPLSAESRRAQLEALHKDPVYLEMKKSQHKQPWMDFTSRHIGPRDEDVAEMLRVLGPGAETLDSFIAQVIPEDVMLPPQKTIQHKTYSESGIAKAFKAMNKENDIKVWMNGGGYYPVEVPTVIKRNILENPAWYTSYTPYQAEISQGRLQSLLNFQTMISDLTGLPVANASLLDEGTAAAEAMTMSLSNLSTSRAKREGKTYVVSHLVHDTTFRVMQGRAEGFGVPLGFGGPHAAFMAVKENSKRRLPGRLIGVSKDRTGGRALRLALQTREQHIRREKATSNVCTAQALLANMAAMYAIYHGPAQLKEMAVNNLRFARMLQAAAQHYGLEVPTRTLDAEGRVLSDTVTLRFAEPNVCQALRRELYEQGISSGKTWTRDEVVLAVPTTFTQDTYVRIVKAFQTVASKNHTDRDLDVAHKFWTEGFQQSSEDIVNGIPPAVRRESAYLTHPVFNTHHSETEMLRYMHLLQSKDLSLVHSMIPLGSCTMKLNGTTQMELIGAENISNIHPHAPSSAVKGYQRLFSATSNQLSALTGMDATSLQPNSGAQGEFAGLRVIRKYHEQQPGAKRDICLIPVSAHGTNPASASMTGMLDLADLEAKCKKHQAELGAIMITYPSTFGVFEPNIRKVCEIVHEHGGLVYMDGANMNAQIGLTSPGALGADVCHLNLHKTFCIPHGGGGPGIGPICVKGFLEPYLPHKDSQTPVASASFGSASIVPISWSYIATMGECDLYLHRNNFANTVVGDEGLRKATKTALLNANYLLARLKDHYPILYTNDNGRCAHEFIVDIRPFKASAGIEVVDVAKRLQDYGFHSPTMSWPVPNTLMIEPTESESKDELDRFVEAMISIRQEIREIEEGKQPKEGNVLRNSGRPHRRRRRGQVGQALLEAEGCLPAALSVREEVLAHGGACG